MEKETWTHVFLETNVSGLSIDFIANIREESHFIVLCSWHLLNKTCAPRQILQSNLQFHIETDGEIKIQYYYWSSVEAELQRIYNVEWLQFQPMCPGHSCKTKSVYMSEKILTSSGASFRFSFHSNGICIFPLRQDMSKDCDCSLWVKCLKKTCNLNCCRAHQYEIGLVEGNKM